MTDTVDDVVVVGQRRRDGSTDPFPSEPSTPEPQWPGQDAEIEPDQGTHPCDDPATREEWDADAASRAARERFLAEAAAAGENGLTYRERGAWLLRGRDGRIRVGPTILGSVFQPGVRPVTAFDLAGVDPREIVGFAHNHNVGQHAPSYDAAANYGDAEAMAAIAQIITDHGGNGDALRMYIIAQTEGQNPYNKINVYTKANATTASRTGAAGPEVNPNAQSCPL